VTASVEASFCDLSSSSVVTVSGEDAVSFLHSQLTSDVAGLAVNRAQFSGYCSPKGRLYAVFLLVRREGDVLLQIPRTLGAAIAQRLSKYVLRSRVRVSDATDRFSVFGIMGSEICSTLGAPERPHEATSVAGALLTRLDEDRALVITDVDRAPAWRERLQDFDKVDEHLWNLLEIRAGVPLVTPSLQEEFVPQMLNLDLLGGISYSKGCYPGQEIVARTHYLGRLKQRMHRIQVRTGTALNPGDRLYSTHFREQASGSVVRAEPANSSIQEALAVLQMDSVQVGDLRYGAPDGPAIELLSLPYLSS
jgi:tRNA-modifying protein YgfZ